MYTNAEYIVEMTQEALKHRHSSEAAKDEDEAIEVCEEMMKALKIREFISSKLIFPSIISNTH